MVTTKRGREATKQKIAYEEYRKSNMSIPVLVHDHTHTQCVIV